MTAGALAAATTLALVATATADTAAASDVDTAAGTVDVAALTRWWSGAGAAPAAVGALLDELAHPTALVVSGAVSLGSYEGGFVHAYVQYLLAARDLAARVRARAGLAPDPGQASAAALPLTTGASAGAVNAVVAALAACQPPIADPTQSPFFQAWIPVGAQGLAYGPNVGGDGMLSRQPIVDAIARLNANVAANPLRAGCRVDVGLSETRLASRLVTPIPGRQLSVDRQMEQFMFTVGGDGGPAPVVRPFPADPNAVSGVWFPRVGTSDTTASFADVTDLMQASSAFPLAFAPFTLRYRLGDSIESAPYVDGGVFDNTPADLAVRMRKLEAAAVTAKVVDRHQIEKDTRYLVEDPDIVKWPSPPSAHPVDGADHTLLDTWFPFVGNFVASALQVDLMNVIGESRDLAHGIEIPVRTRPTPGAYLAEFLAFFETDFRTFDFYAGMSDAWDYLTANAPGFQLMTAIGALPPVTSPEFACVRAFRGHAEPADGDDPAPCAAVTEPARSNLLALLWATQAALDDGKPDDETELWANLGKAWGRGGHRFRFRDLRALGGDAATPDTARGAIRKVMQDAIVRFGHAQGTPAADLAVASVAEAGANFYDYRPPPAFVGVGLLWDGLLDVKLASPSSSFGLRVDADLRVAHLHDLALDPGPGAERDTAFSYEAAAHVVEELPLQHLPGFPQATLQLAIGAGYGAASLQTWNGPLMFRHGPEGVVSAAVFQRVYFAVSAMRFLDHCAFNNACAGADPTARAHLSPIATSAWDVNLTLGFRFFID